VRRPRTTQRVPPYTRYPNLVHAVTMVRPDQVWVGAMTSVRWRQACMDVAVGRDVYTRRGRYVIDVDSNGCTERWSMG
jgi:putative transposase